MLGMRTIILIHVFAYTFLLSSSPIYLINFYDLCATFCLDSLSRVDLFTHTVLISTLIIYLDLDFSVFFYFIVRHQDFESISSQSAQL